jgi:hypothetical protein
MMWFVRSDAVGNQFAREGDLLHAGGGMRVVSMQCGGDRAASLNRAAAARWIAAPRIAARRIAARRIAARFPAGNDHLERRFLAIPAGKLRGRRQR